MKKKMGETLSRFTALACVTILSSGLVLGGCAGKGGAEGEEGAELQKDNSILVETAAPKTESIELTGSFMGTVEAENEVTVIAKVGGDVTAAYFEEGDRVNAGDLLFTIDDRSAQISMAQAQASLESASATVSSASAGASAAELNLLYTQEQIKENLGTAETSRMQLENAVAQAKYALKAAQESWEFAKENFGIEKDAYHDLENALEHAGKHRKEYTKEADALDAYAKNYTRLKNASGTYDDNPLPENSLHDVMVELGLTPATLGVSGNATSTEVADAYLRTCTEFGDIYTIGVAANAFRSAAAMEENAEMEADSSKNASKLALFDTAIRLEQAEDNVKTAEDAKRLAEKMLEDFNLYTMATIWVGSNADLAGTNSKLISAQAGVIQAQAGVKSAQAGVEAAQLQLEYTQVTAPVSGVITKKNVTVNNMAPQGSEAYVIAADEGANVVFYVAESVMRELALGQTVTVERNGSTYEAAITENAGVADTESGLFEIKAQLLAGADALIAGTSVKLTMATQSAENVLTIPVDSVYYENQKAFVYCMVDGKAVKTQIETGITNNENVEVRSGLTKDSQVIVTWASQLKDGAEVKLKGSTAAEEKAPAENASEETPAQEDTVTKSNDEAVEAASIEGTELSDTAKLSLSIEERIMQENEVQ